MLAILTICGLFASGPALAADDVVPIPEISTVLDTAAPETDDSSGGPGTQPPVPAIPDSAEPPVTVDVHVDGGNVDVSVRVLSPGGDGSTSSDGANPPVVSNSETPDITTATEATQPQSSAETSEGSNVNVAVRVLSPGDDGAVEQSTSAGAEREASEAANATDDDSAKGDPDPDAPRSDLPTTGDESLMAVETPAQYHDEDSRYQSESEFAPDPWQWLWYLSVDCDGNVTSASTETGRQTSSDWDWEWEWEWACDSPAHPPPLDTAHPPPVGPPERTADGEPAPSEPAPPSPSDGADEGPAVPAGAVPSVASGDEGGPWRWTWTFTFCGETSSATLPIAVQTDRHWEWDWTWDWTCESGPATGSATTTPSSPSSSMPSPASANAAPAGSSDTGAGGTGSNTADGSGAPPLPAVSVQLPGWVVPLRPLPELGSAVPISLVALLSSLGTTVSVVVAAGGQPMTLPRSPLELPVPAGVDVSIVIGPDASVPAPEREEPALRPPVGGPEATNGAGAVTPSGGVAPHAVTQPASSASSRATAKPAPARPSVRPSSPRREREPLAPFGRLGSSTGGGAGTSGGRVPTTPVVAVAALLAFFMLAAPGLGWRIRAARELSPRSAYRSSIDHPG